MSKSSSVDRTPVHAIAIGTIQWVDAEGAKQIPKGRTVISRRLVNGETHYDVSHHHRPDWVDDANNRPGEWSWAILDGEPEAWSLCDVLRRLTQAAETLMSQYSYDGHGYEEITECIKRAKAIVGQSQ